MKFVTTLAFHHTGFLDTWLRSNVPIVPKTVWSVIFASQRASGRSLEDFSNDWWDSSFNASRKVCSGSYVTYYRSATHDVAIYKLRTDWWGAGMIHTDLPDGGIPTTPYIDMNHFASNTLQDHAFLSWV